VELSLFNSLGQRVYLSEYPNFSGIFSNQVNVSNLSGGVYVLQVLAGNKSYVQKLLIK